MVPVAPVAASEAPSALGRLRLAYVAPSALVRAPYNPRTMTDEARAALKRGIEAFGLVDPLVARGEDGLLLGGHQRLHAAEELGLAEVPVVYMDGVTDDQAAALNVLLNNPSAQGAWDMARLSSLLSELDANGFDATLTGFSEKDLEGLLTWTGEPEPLLTDADEVPDVPPEPVTALGDIITLGRHRLMCGDATSFEHVERLTEGTVPQMAYCDPPYGIEIVQGGWVGGGEANNIPFGGVPKGETAVARQRRLGTANGSKPFGSKDVRGTVGSSNVVEVNRYAPVIGDDSTQTAIDAYTLCAALGIPVLIFWGGNYYANALPPSSCWIVWDKENTGNFADAELAWTNQPTAVRIFRHMWNGMVRASERGQRRVHPTQKPVALAEWCFDKYGKPGDAVLDLFGGSGSTLIAAEKAGRTALMMEMSPAYCDVIVTRWENATGQKAVRP